MAVHSSEVGLAGTLFLNSLELFRILSNTVGGVATLKQSHGSAFKQELESYLLWGNHYDPAGGRLDRVVMALSQELRNGLLSYIGSIGQILCRRLHSISCWPEDLWPYEQSAELSKMIDNLDDIGVEIDKSIIDDDYMDFIVEDLRSNIEFLHEMNPALDDIAASIDVAELDTSLTRTEQPLSVSGPALHYCRKILDRFPLAEVLAVERLGMAGWLRHNRIREVFEMAAENRERCYEASFVKDSARANTTNEMKSKFHDSGLGLSMKTESVYAVSQAIYQSFMSSQADIENGHLRLPPLPCEASSGEPFVCSICGLLIDDVKNKHQWKHHVYSDLRPYDCFVAGCDSTNAFASRGEFAAHLAEHRFNITWSCKKCGHVDTDRGKFRGHLDSEHLGIPAEYILDIEKASERRTPRNLEREKCPLCGKIPTAMKYIGHVSHHLEELSLSAIPQGVDPDSDLSCSSSDADILGFSVTAPDVSDYHPSSLRSIAEGIVLDPEQGYTGTSGLDTRGTRHSTAIDPPLTPLDHELTEFAFRAPSRRPANGKIKCELCNGVPDGFCGEHELRRHMEHAHSTLRKFWICIDISTDQKMLANCKSCKAGKQYGAYYNAAAHLRRVHFNSRHKGRKGKDALEEKRGGKGGGGWPPMEELKNWMEQKEEYTEVYNIKCICGFVEDDGRTILCDKCGTWQHVDCYYAMQNVPGQDDNHYCADCNPGTLIDREKAIKRQMKRRELLNISLGGIDETLQSKPSTLRQKLQQHQSDLISASPIGLHRVQSNPGPVSPAPNTGLSTTFILDDLCEQTPIQRQPFQAALPSLFEPLLPQFEISQLNTGENQASTEALDGLQ